MKQVIVDYIPFSVTPKGVALYKCIPLPHIVAVIPVPLIASKVVFISLKILA